MSLKYFDVNNLMQKYFNLTADIGMSNTYIDLVVDQVFSFGTENNTNYDISDFHNFRTTRTLPG